VADYAFGLLNFRGRDARSFLQGQLSNDMELLGNQEPLLAGYHNPQGRVLALLRLIAPEKELVVALLSQDLVETIGAALRRFVLRAKVTIDPDNSSAALATLADKRPAVASLLAPGARDRAIAAGVPQVYAATSAAFVAQMLNLDCVQAVSWTKGCYTGQEIIARAHYRGRIKRRMQRFLSSGEAELTPGENILLADGRAAHVVDSAARADGRSEFLAVAPLPGVSDPGATPESAAPAPDRLACEPLPLPYALPE
jgi:folate-binding protein YgfZ